MVAVDLFAGGGFGSLFSGIGLLDLGLQRAGLGAPAWQVEIDPWCRRVLARHWPDAERFEDVRSFTPTRVPVIVGGFPCQPYSVAGARRGSSDERALWPHFARVIREARPAIVIAENVPGLRTLALRGVLADLAELGFDAEWCCFRASDLGAPHQRNRIWLVATHPERVDVRREPGWLSRQIGAAQEAQYRRDRKIVAADAAGVGQQGSDGPQARRWAASQRHREDLASDADGEGRVQQAIRVATERGWAEYCGWHLDPTPRMDDGSTGRMDKPRRGELGHRRKALGNGVVVACAELVGRSILDVIPCYQQL